MGDSNNPLKCKPLALLNTDYKGLHIVGYSVPCVLVTRDGIPLREI